MSLDPKYKIRYKNGDRVQVAIAGDVNNIVNGTITGLVNEHIIDIWIVTLDKNLPEWPYNSIAQQHTFIRPLGDNKPFLCEVHLWN